ncbi:MAG TPA: pyridoxal-phosphate dependent enzyme [Saprospiraceae bacterium]|nr:pyridoxal-phosphate dependent enzyme [Saprospiraceae bacterium]
MERFQDLFDPGQESPLVSFQADWLRERDIRCWVKRDDLLALPVKGDPLAFSGNKWRKLKWNLVEAARQGHQQLLSFGGAFSNHIVALAAAGYLFGFQTVGVIRGECPEPLNPSLAFAKKCGMQLHFISRSDYRRKNEASFQQVLQSQVGDSYMIPEGGSNALALKGTAELADTIKRQLGELPEGIHLCCGTGGTAAGLIQGLGGASQVFGYSVLKGDFHEKEIESFLDENPKNWHIHTEFHHGGYAKTTSALLGFIREFPDHYGFYIDPIYTGKLFWAFRQKVLRGQIPGGSRHVLIHSGGLQGIRGYNQRFGTKLPLPPT